MIKNSEFTYRGVAASALILAFALHTTHVSAAETCVSAPTCAELGYTLTSTTNCVGTALKCPFDASKFYCVTSDDIVPKWENYHYVDKWDDSGSGGYNNFTMPKAGCILGTMGGAADRYYIRINNTSGNPEFAGNKSDLPISYEHNGQFFFCLKKGDKFSLVNNKNEYPKDYRFRVMYFN